MGKLIPKYCPNCGSTNIHNQELESPHEWEEWYDVYCRDCEWSGDISPDLPLGKTTLEEIKTQLGSLNPILKRNSESKP
jgi:hypothetical protein